jgi:phosphoglycolate phosphatase-like HAD superfamily hydrolase
MKTAYIFDFDDTLAHTEGSIGIARFIEGEPVDPREWLRELGIPESHVMEYHDSGNRHAAYLTSAGFREYVASSKPFIANGDLRTVEPGKETGYGVEDVIDFSQIIDIVNPTPIGEVVAVAKRAVQDGHVVGVVTGRKGMGTTVGLDGKQHPITTRSQIQKFLAMQGVPVALEDIYGVGHMPGTVASNKARVVQSQFIDKYGVDRVKFYDDDGHNLDSVAALDSVEVRVSVFDTRHSLSGSEVKDIVEMARRRRSQSRDWSRTRELAKLNRR